jgi:methionine-rich copper-binding protein CopC
MTYVVVTLVLVAIAAVAYALVVKKNPKVQADVTKAVSQVQASAVTAQAAATQVVADVKKL